MPLEWLPLHYLLTAFAFVQTEALGERRKHQPAPFCAAIGIATCYYTHDQPKLLNYRIGRVPELWIRTANAMFWPLASSS